MANEAASRQGRNPATPQNSAAMGFILVIAGVVIALLLFVAGGNSNDSVANGSGATGAGAGAGGGGSASKSTTTTTAPAPKITDPAALALVVGNGSGKTGRGKKTAAKLIASGYVKATGVDGKPSAVTTIYFIDGAKDDAVAVARSMGLGEDHVAQMPAATPLKVPVGAARVVVLVGLDVDPATATFSPAATP